jgi:hypothetical protein
MCFIPTSFAAGCRGSILRQNVLAEAMSHWQDVIIVPEKKEKPQREGCGSKEGLNK